jgi:hypothetical protein
MIDITSTRQNAFNMHPPAVVFLLLFAFSCGAAFLAGYKFDRAWPELVLHGRLRHSGNRNGLCHA